MRIWLAGAPLVAALAAAVLLVGGEVRGGPPGDTLKRTEPAAPRALPLPGRDLLTPAEAEAARQAGLLPAGVKSLLDAGDQLRHGDFKWNDQDVPAGKLLVWVDLRRQMISVFRDGHEIGTAVVVYGADGMQTPVGRFTVLRKAADYHSRAYDAPMPFAMFITNTGVALHGSVMSSRHATHGCVGLPTDFAQLLFRQVKIGDRVEVVSSNPDAIRSLKAAPGS